MTRELKLLSKVCFFFLTANRLRAANYKAEMQEDYLQAKHKMMSLRLTCIPKLRDFVGFYFFYRRLKNARMHFRHGPLSPKWKSREFVEQTRGTCNKVAKLAGNFVAFARLLEYANTAVSRGSDRCILRIN